LEPIFLCPLLSYSEKQPENVAMLGLTPFFGPSVIEAFEEIIRRKDLGPK